MAMDSIIRTSPSTSPGAAPEGEARMNSSSAWRLRKSTRRSSYSKPISSSIHNTRSPRVGGAPKTVIMLSVLPGQDSCLVGPGPYWLF